MPPNQRLKLDPARSAENHISDHLAGDLQTANFFMFEVVGVKIGAFREVSGLEVKLNMESITEGGQNSFIHQVPGRMEWTPITFKRGVTNADALFDWFYNTSGEGFAKKGDKIIRRDGAISAYSRDGIRLREWTIRATIPISWKGPAFGVDKAEPLEEELIVSHQGFRVAPNRAEKKGK